MRRIRKLSPTQKFNLQRNETIAVLAKALSAFLGSDQAIFIEANGRKYIVCWKGDKISVQSAKDFEGFQDGLLLQKREPSVPETTPLLEEPSEETHEREVETDVRDVVQE